MKNGKFIVIEGIDGAGTTTQSKLLHKYLTDMGVRTHITREPSDGRLGRMVREVLSGRLASSAGTPFDRRALALLFAADRMDHIISEIAPKINACEVVISDRYTLSSLAYQSIDCDLRWVETLNSQAMLPDLYIFLRVPPSVSLKRIENSRKKKDIFEELMFLEKVASAYEKAMKGIPGHLLHVIDGELTRDEVFEKIRAATVQLLGTGGDNV